MNTENCMLCDNMFDNKKGKYIIVVNEPKGSPCPAPVKITTLEQSMELSLMTNSIYVGQTDKPIHISARYALNRPSQSDFIKINPKELTHIELDYEYSMLNNNYVVEKVVLKKVGQRNSSY